MATEVIDYKAVIEDLERKRQLMNVRFDAAIGAINQVIALNSSGAQPDLPGIRSLPQPQPASGSAYRAMGMVEAARTHISIVKRPVPNMELAAALVTGGFPHKSKNFPNTLNSVLWRRAKTVGDVTKSSKGWGLAEWKRGLSLKSKDSVSAENEHKTED